MLKDNKYKTLLIVLLVVCLLGMSSQIVFRVTVFFHSPTSAFKMEFKEIENEGSELDIVKFYRITKNPPYEWETDHELYTWAVYKFGPFYYVKYYGEG